MVQNTQNYLNGLINKSKIAYLDLSSTCQVSNCEKCNKKTYSENSSQLTGEIEDLSEFANLRVVNASNGKFTKLEGLFSLPNKNKLEKINLFGNRISEVDLAHLFSEFPNLKYLNLDRNPLSAKNLENLTDKQLEKLAEGLKNKSIRISLYQGTILSDLLELTQKLISKGGSSQAHRLQTILQRGSVRNEQLNKTDYVPWVFGGIGISLALVVGYLVGKQKKEGVED